MTKTAVSLALLAATLLGCATPNQDRTGSADTAAEVAAFLSRYLKAIDSRDETTLRDSYVAGDRFAWIEDGKLRYRSADEVVAGLKTLPASTPIRTELKDLVVVPVGTNGAHARAGFTTVIGSPPSGFMFGGVISLVLERQGNAWRLVAGHTSSPSRR